MTRQAQHRPRERRVWFAVMRAIALLPCSQRPDSLVMRVYFWAVVKAAECCGWEAVDALDEEIWP